MNDSVPVVAKPAARDHAPPDRSPEPAPSDAFAAALGAAQPAEAPPPAADPTARTAHAEGTKAEGDSSGPHIRKGPHARAHARATAPVPPASAPAAAITQAPSAPVSGAHVAADQPVPATPPAAALPADSATPAPGVPASVLGQAPAPEAATAVQPPAAVGAPAVQATSPAVQGAAQAEAQPAKGTEPAAEAVLETNAAAAVASDRPVRSPQREAADRTTRPERSRGRGERASQPAPATVAGRHARLHNTPAAHRGPAPATPANARPSDAAAPAHAPAEAQVQPSGRTTEPARIAERPVADQPQQDARTRVRLRDVPDAARATLRVALKTNGAATARINLHPADLGGVRITMRVHDGTVAATLAAETPAAAQALAQTASDLRRSLEGQGLHVASLDVHVAGDGPASSGDRQKASDRAHAMNDNDRAASDDAVDITNELHLVPLGTQVDVLA
jgi:flagellar hook-length control protein FliK